MRNLGALVVLLFTLGFGSAALAEHGSNWYGEQAYLQCNADVHRAVYRGEFRSGYEHYVRHGRYEGRITDGRCFAYDAPHWFDEHGYLQCNPDVNRAVWRREFVSGWHHYRAHGRREGRAPGCHH